MLEKMGVHSYVVQYYDPYDKVTRKATGLVAGATVLDCVKWLSDYYGEESLYVAEINLAEEGPLEMTNEEV